MTRNTIDKPTLYLEEHGAVDGGSMDSATAWVTGSYPPEGYGRNNESTMYIVPRSGFGGVVLRISGRDQVHEFKPNYKHPIVIPKETSYYYSADEGQTLTFDMISSPSWSADQYEHLTDDDVN